MQCGGTKGTKIASMGMNSIELDRIWIVGVCLHLKIDDSYHLWKNRLSLNEGGRDQ